MLHMRLENILRDRAEKLPALTSAVLPGQNLKICFERCGKFAGTVITDCLRNFSDAEVGVF